MINQLYMKPEWTKKSESFIKFQFYVICIKSTRIYCFQEMLSHCVDMFFKCLSSVKYVSPTLASLFKGNFTFPEKYLLSLILLF